MSITLEPCRRAQLERYRSLYMTAFPQEERAPWRLLLRRGEQGRADMLAAMDGGEFAGLAYIVTHADSAYLFYLAVEGSRRGRGTGGQILSALKERYKGKRLFLAREMLDSSAENYPQRESRHRFYLANGFQDWGIHIKEGPVTYDVMGIGEIVTAPEYRALMKSWTGWLWGLGFRAHIVEK